MEKRIMKNKSLNKKDLKISLIITLLCSIGTIFVLLYQSNLVPSEINGMSKDVILLISFLQSVVLIFIASFLGLKLARATNFNKGILGWAYSQGENRYRINKKSLAIAIGISFLCATLMMLSEKFLWSVYIPEINDSMYKFDIIYLLSGIIYGGIAEEVLLRLFTLSFIVFILYKVFARKKDKTNIPNSIYFISIFIAAILFAIGHLPMTMSIFGIVDMAVILRMLILNGIPGIFFGYLYWKKGLEYAIISHMFIHIFTQLFWSPILF
ncbi:hypothetical protein TVTCOM_19290 [Terrisporobacter vanillatitrophus]